MKYNLKSLEKLQTTIYKSRDELIEDICSMHKHLRAYETLALYITKDLAIDLGFLLNEDLTATLEPFLMTDYCIMTFAWDDLFQFDIESICLENPLKAEADFTLIYDTEYKQSVLSEVINYEDMVLCFTFEGEE